MLGEYVNCNEAWVVMDCDLLPADRICEIISELLWKLKDEVYPESSSSLRYYKTYFLIGKPYSRNADHNLLQIYICFEKNTVWEHKETVYLPVEFEDLVLQLDGTLELRSEKGIGKGAITDIDDTLKALERDFEVDEVYIEFIE